MKYIAIILSILILCVAVSGAQEELSLQNFTGLNTQSGDFVIKPNEARVAHEIDFSRAGVGVIAKRYGYDSVSAMVGMDSLLAIYGAYYRDGTQQLIVVADSTGVGYGGVYVTPKGSVNLDSATKIWNYWGIQEPVSFAMYRDQIYMANGSQKPVVWTGDVARSFPLNAPGEPRIVPLSGGASGYSLNGEYIYQLSGGIWTGGVQHSLDYGFLTSIVRVKSGRILLNNIPYLQTDSVGWYADSTKNNVDSLHLKISRTKANPGLVNGLDSAWVVLDTTLDSAGLAAFTFIDSTSDDSMTGSKVALLHKTNKGRDSLGVISRRPGAPAFISTYDTMSYSNPTTENAGVFYGITGQRDTLGVSYVVSFMDTLTGIESDTGRACVVWVDTGQRSASYKPRGYRISLPPAAVSDTEIVYNLYRAQILQITHDSAFTWLDSIFANVRGDHRPIGIAPPRQSYALAVDTILLSEYRLLAQISTDSTQYTDSVRWDSLATKRIYARATPPSFMHSLFAFDGRLFGLAGSRLYMSRLDSAQAWGALDFIALGENDGDEATIAYPSRGVIRVLKNRSAYNVYQDASLQWNRNEVSGLYGSIAKRSYAKGFGGNYFLSDVGVLRENEGQYLARTQSAQLASARLDNLDKLPVTTKEAARAFYFDQKYMLCIGDTTYVYDEKADAWSTWSMTFLDATLYGAETNVGFFPGDTMYFVKSGSNSVFRYGTSESDNGTDVTINYRTAPLLVDGNYNSIREVGVWINTSDSTSGYLGLKLYGEDGTQTGTTQTLSPVTSTRFIRLAVDPVEKLFYQLQITSAAGWPLINSSIDGLNIYWQGVGKPITQ